MMVLCCAVLCCDVMCCAVMCCELCVVFGVWCVACGVWCALFTVYMYASVFLCIHSFRAKQQLSQQPDPTRAHAAAHRFLCIHAFMYTYVCMYKISTASVQNCDRCITSK